MWLEWKEAHLGLGNFLSRGKGSLDQAAIDAKPRQGCGAVDEHNDGGEVEQGLAGPVFTNWTEEAVLDGIPLRRACRVVADGNGEPERDNQLLMQFPFPGANPGAVTAAAVGQDEKFIGVRVVFATKVTPPEGDVVGGEGRGVVREANENRTMIVGHIEDPVGNGHVAGIGTEVVIQHWGWLQTPNPAGILEIADQLLLGSSPFRVGNF